MSDLSRLNRDWRERRLAKKTAENARLAEELAEERKRRTALEELYAKPEDERGPNDTLVTKDEAVDEGLSCKSGGRGGHDLLVRVDRGGIGVGIGA